MKDLPAAKCKYFHLSLDRRSMVLVNAVPVKQKWSCRTRLKYVELPFPGAQIVTVTLREMRVGKRAKGWGRKQCVFSRPTLLPRRPPSGSRRPVETIKVGKWKSKLIFYMLHLFPIHFLVDKVKKKKTEKIVIPRQD